MSNFYIEKNKSTNETIYLEFDKLKGYNIKPKKQPDDAILVNKIVFVSPTLTEKLIRKKIDLQINKFLNAIKDYNEDDSDDESGIRKTLEDAERLKLNIITNYVKFLGNTYQSLTLKKIQIIINELRMKLYDIRERKQLLMFYEQFKNTETRPKGR